MYLQSKYIMYLTWISVNMDFILFDVTARYPQWKCYSSDWLITFVRPIRIEFTLRKLGWFSTYKVIDTDWHHTLHLIITTGSKMFGIQIVNQIVLKSVKLCTSGQKQVTSQIWTWKVSLWHWLSLKQFDSNSNCWQCDWLAAGCKEFNLQRSPQSLTYFSVWMQYFFYKMKDKIQNNNVK